MSWASRRQTSRVEDMAYCLLGLFDVNLPLLYGEGMKAFTRLQREIIRHSSDQSIFAWTTKSRAENTGMFASDPSAFANSGDVVQLPKAFPSKEVVPYEVTNRGLRIKLPFITRNGLLSYTYLAHSKEHTLYQVKLGCCRSYAPETNLSILLLEDPNNESVRYDSNTLVMEQYKEVDSKIFYVTNPSAHQPAADKPHLWSSICLYVAPDLQAEGISVLDISSNAPKEIQLHNDRSQISRYISSREEAPRLITLTAFKGTEHILCWNDLLDPCHNGAWTRASRLRDPPEIFISMAGKSIDYEATVQALRNLLRLSFKCPVPARERLNLDELVSSDLKTLHFDRNDSVLLPWVEGKDLQVTLRHEMAVNQEFPTLVISVEFAKGDVSRIFETPFLK
ncbi:uncharacterized protein KY384_006723 [Bacidia gigantensis]|uniref:uncharacterized protein n=1 Tax=Bacidia gigantensis TaxID=2732470 RepID=UPI001D0531FD|nr:uncharacterized protein KY384_006723 [Bacidia gigantensis]KAG8529033.1 hypothetical protein KY384_006723 [Bacidia gigantensis]